MMLEKDIFRHMICEIFAEDISSTVKFRMGNFAKDCLQHFDHNVEILT